MTHTFKLIDFKVYDEKTGDEDDEDYNKYEDNHEFKIQMFGINESGETAAIYVTGFNPFFFAKVPDDWTNYNKNAFISELKMKVGKYYKKSIVLSKLLNRKKLYGFDGGQQHQFILIKFANTRALNKAKNLWYLYTQDGDRILKPGGYNFKGAGLELYESQIPPLLRLFHIREISPSGWIQLNPDKIDKLGESEKTTTCKYEYEANYKYIDPLPEKETIVPYKICSFDIEASSSHGDFPLPKKKYKKLATNIMEIWEKNNTPRTEEYLVNIIYTAFEFDDLPNVDLVYPKYEIGKKTLAIIIKSWLMLQPAHIKRTADEEMDLEDNLADMNETHDVAEGAVVVDEFATGFKKFNKIFPYKEKGANVLDMLNDDLCNRNTKIDELNKTLTKVFPPLQGDKVTFIGSTFMRYGEETPYYNHCIALDTCSDVPGAEIESYKTEREVLLAWAEIIQREDPDIIIGYNIFGFDYDFMYQRAQELDCVNDFLKLSRNMDEVCLSKKWDFNAKKEKIGLEESSIVLASGQHDLKFVKMNGRVHIDLYNCFRRDFSLASYKLSYVSGYFIRDKVSAFEATAEGNTKVISKNLVGLENNSYVVFEIIGHSSDMYQEGQKFEITNVNKVEGSFEIVGQHHFDADKKIFWCLGKDDVTPQDIFRMTNEGPNERAVIAKYCLQDCNLLHTIFNKLDFMTGYVEMAKLCSVPIDFLVRRGQGIKLTSYLSKKCREKGVLMPVVEKNTTSAGFEGAIVLEPKRGLYVENPIACVDFASLYPSCIISENISHDSKVWTKEYDLEGKLIKETGKKDKNGAYIHDNLDTYEYLDIRYDTYEYVKKTPKAAAKKVKCGHKICHYAQYPEGRGRAILPSILEELLAARKATKKLIKTENDTFMKNILDKRQLSIKLTANSLYGATGAKTSSFCDIDVAASTTATGRKLLIAARDYIEAEYKDREVDTEHGLVKTNAEYIYGDTDSVFFTFNLEDLDGKKITGKKALELTIKLGQEAGKSFTQRHLKYPHDLEYEKVFWPWFLMSKKRYVGMLYEMSPDECYRKSMGLVLKRRDNAPIVKDIYGGIIDILMSDTGVKKSIKIEKAIKFLHDSLRTLKTGQVPLEKLIISKSLRSGYKNPRTIAHKVLADRITERDPGNKPSPGDRMDYAFIVQPNKKALQGERIETPEYIRGNQLDLDYNFYITNSIMKPVQQVFSLILEDIKGFKKKKGQTLRIWKKELEDLRISCEGDIEKYKRKEETLRNKEVKMLLFDEFINL